MKLRFKLFSIFLSVLIVFISSFQFSFISYAKIYRDDEGHPHVENFSDIAEFGVNWVLWASSQLGAVVTHDFSKFVENEAAWNSLWTEENVVISEDGSSVTFSEDLTAYIKQALIEYNEEINGFKLYPTINYLSVSPSKFKNIYLYKTFCNLIRENGIIDVNTNSSYGFDRSDTMIVCVPFRQITEDSVSLVAGTVYTGAIIVQGKFYGTNTWKLYSVQAKSFPTVYSNSDGSLTYKEYENFSSGTDITNSPYAFPTSGLLDIRGTYPTGSVGGWTFFSNDGRKLKVFNSLNALKNYTVGQRSVYFGSGFYDTPTEIKISIEDLEKSKDIDYDKLLNDLKDLIGKETDNEDSLTEEDLERLVDKLLEGLNNSGGGSGGNDNPGGNNNSGGTGDNTGFLQGMLDTISGYLDSILEYLDGILLELGYISDQIDDLTADAVEEKTDSLLSELFSAFGEIGDLLKTKFPFSIPWDIYSILSFLGSDDPVDGSPRAAPVSYFGDDGIMAYSSESGLVIAYDEVKTLSSDSDADYGIMLMSDDDVNGSDHGGGGASRPGNDSGSDSSNDGSHGGGGSSRPGSGSHYDSEGKYHRAPFYEVPFQISKSMGIEGTLIIDLDPFIPLSEISRTMFTCIFIMSLVNLSVRIIDALGDLFPSG